MNKIILILAFSLSPCALAYAEEARKSTSAAESAGGSLLQVTLGLGVVLLLIFAVAWFVRRFTVLPGVSSGAMRVLSVLPMGQREKLVLVQVGDQQLLLGVSVGRINTLHVLDKPIESMSPEALNLDSFGDRFRSILKQRLSQ